MAEKPKKPGKEPLAEGNARADIVDDICSQITPHLPIRSRDELGKKVGELRIGRHVIPMSLIAPHISDDAFPVTDRDDLRRKAAEGAERAISIGRMSGFRPRTESFDRALGELSQIEAKIGLQRPAAYKIYYPD